MEIVGIVVVALAVGMAAGVVVALRRRGPEPSLVLEGWLEAHAAELRRVGDAARSRDGEQDRLRSEVQAAREAVDSLRVRDEERRARDVEHADVVRRLAAVLAGGSA